MFAAASGGGGGASAHSIMGERDQVLVVLGGSLGALAINTAVQGVISKLLTDDGKGRRLWVVWQAGAGGFDELRVRVPPHPRLLLTPFLDRMEVAYGAADLAVGTDTLRHGHRYITLQMQNVQRHAATETYSYRYRML